MAEKLRSILRRIHWSLALRAAVFAVSWFFLPFWIFLLVAFYLYFIPLFQPGKLALPFAVIIFFAATEPVSPWLAVFFGILWYLILGIKDLVFIDRKADYEMLILLILFLLTIGFFAHAGYWRGIGTALYSLAMGIVIFLLCRGFMRYGSRGAEDNGSWAKKGNIAAAIVALILFEFSFPLLILPLHFLYQASLFFVIAAVLIESMFEYSKGTLTRNAALLNLSIFFTFMVIILGSAQWTL